MSNAFGFQQSEPPADPAPTAAPEAPAAPATPEPAAGADQQPPAVHPAWDKALEAIPGPWQEPIRKQIAETEREHQRALEQARQSGVDPEWAALAQEAKELGVSVQDLAAAYQGQQQLYEAMVADPDQFLKDIQEQIEQAVKSGQITRKQGAQAMQQAQDAVDDLETPEQKQLRELQEWRQQREQAEQQQQLTAQQQQIQQDADNEAEAFMTAVWDAFDADPQLAGANDATRGIAANVASSILDADPTGRLTYEQAAAGAIQMLREQMGWQGAPAPQQQGQAQPNPAAAIGGGGAAPAPGQPPRFDLRTPEGREARDAWLTQATMEYNEANKQGSL